MYNCTAMRMIALHFTLQNFASHKLRGCDFETVVTEIQMREVCEQREVDGEFVSEEEGYCVGNCRKRCVVWV
jgi:hypothetical protein